MCVCVIDSLKPTTLPVVFVVECSFDKLYKSRMLGLNLPILLTLVRQEHCLAIENLGRLVQCVTWHCHSERYYH